MTMEKSAFLLVATLCLWMLQTTMPVFQEFFPTVTLSRNSAQLQPPLTQLLNQFIGFLQQLSAYCLLQERAGGRLSLKDNLLFLTVGFLITTGHGMHSVCVAVEGLGEVVVQTPQIFVLVDFLHEVVSHNMFVCGIYLLMALLMNTEVDCYGYKMKKKLDGHVHLNETSRYNGESCTNKHQGRQASVSSGVAIRNFLLHWTFPVILGAYFSIFATMTGTVVATVVFYLALCAYALATLRDLSSVSELQSTDLMVFGTMAKAACIGLPVLALRLAL